MRRYALMGLMFVVSAGLWMHSYAERGDVPYDTDTVVLRVEKKSVTVSDAMIYLMKSKQDVEKKWGSKIWKAQTGTDEDGNPITYESNRKDDVQKEMIMTETLSQVAGKQGIKLSKKEKKKCKQMAREEMRKLDSKDLITYGITTEKMTSYYEDQALAYKVKQEILKDFEVEYETADVKKMRIYEMLFPIYEENSDGVKELVSEQKQESQEEKAKEAKQEVEKGTSIEKVSKEYHLEYSGETVISESEVSAEENEAIEDLDNGEVSEVIKTNQGYLVVQMIDKNDKKATKKAEEKEKIEQEEKEIVRYYKKHYQKDYYIKLQKEIWDQLPLAS